MLLCCLLRAAHTPGGIPHPATPPLGALPTACALCTAIEALSFTIVDPSLPSFPPNIWRLRTPPPLHFRFSEVMVRCSGVGWTCVSMRWRERPHFAKHKKVFFQVSGLSCESIADTGCA